MTRSRLLTGFMALVLSGGLVGCGSLAEKAGDSVLSTSGSDGGLAVGDPAAEDSLATDGTAAGVDAGAGGAAAGGGSGGAAGGTAGSTGGTTGGAGGGSGGTTGGTTGGAPGGAGASGAKPIVVGVTYPDVAALGAVFGVDSSEADPKEWINRIITYINKTGGISGRPMSPVWYKVDLNENMSTSGQRACSAFTQDNKVDVVVNTAITGDTLPACLGKVGVSVIDNIQLATDSTDMRRLRNMFKPNAIRVDRSVGSIVKLSAQRGLLPKGSKLGVLVEDCAWGNRVYQDTLVPLAKQLGVTPVKGTHRCVQNFVADLGPVTNDVQREALRFASEGVTHVIFVSSAEAFVVSRFTIQGNDQKYYPKYFITSTAYPYNNTRSDAMIKHHDTAVPNMTGYGTFPLMDVGPLAAPETPGQKAIQDRCRTADPKEGIYAKDKGKNEGYWFSLNGIRGYCDAFFVLEATLESNGVRFSLSDFTRGYQAALGGKLASAVNAGGAFLVPRDGIDGVGLMRPFAWDAKKKQFVYSGASVRVQ